MRSTQRFLFLGRRVSPPVVGRRGYAALPVSAAAAAVEKALILKEPLEAVLGGRAEGLIRVLRAEVTLCSELTTALEQRGQLRGNDARIVELFQASAGKAAEDIAFYLEQNPLEEMAKEAAASSSSFSSSSLSSMPSEDGGSAFSSSSSSSSMFEQLPLVGGLASSASELASAAASAGLRAASSTASSASSSASSAAHAVGGLASNIASNQAIRTATIVGRSAVEQMVGLESLTARLEAQRAQLRAVTHALQLHSTLRREAENGMLGRSAISEYLVASASLAGLLKINLEVSAKKVKLRGGSGDEGLRIEWTSHWPPEVVGGWDVLLGEGRVRDGNLQSIRRTVLVPIATGLDADARSVEWCPAASDRAMVNGQDKPLRDLCSKLHSYDITVRATPGAVAEDPLPSVSASGIYLEA